MAGNGAVRIDQETTITEGPGMENPSKAEINEIASGSSGLKLSKAPARPPG